MIAAIYARKSNAQDVADDQRSVARQVEHARQFAARKGWEVDEACIFVDDDISGATFDRPGFLRLLAALKPQPVFEALIVSEVSRLGRETFETGFTLKQLSQAGVRVFAYLADTEILLETPTDKFVLSAISFAAELERASASQRVHDTMLHKAARGYVTGGACFGYIHVAVTGADGSRSHVERRVHDDEAAVVCEIFQLCAEGLGVKRIATTLNAHGAPAPRAQRGRLQGWASSSVRAVLYRDLYRGVLVWNRTRQHNAWGQRRVRRRPAAEWITVPVPALRIVSDDLWAAAHRRLQAAAQTYGRHANGTVRGRPPTGLKAPRLLTGLTRCALCGGTMMVHNRVRRGTRQWYYLCTNFNHRGRTACSNNMPLPLGAADDAVLSHFADVVLDPAIVEGAIRDAVAELRPSAEAMETRRTALETELRHVEEEQTRYTAAIAIAGDVSTLAHAVHEREQHRVRLRRELAALVDLQPVRDFDVEGIAHNLRGRLDEWRGLLRCRLAASRQILLQLLDDRIVWTPNTAEGQYEFSGRARFDILLRGLVPREVLRPRTDATARKSGSQAHGYPYPSVVARAGEASIQWRHVRRRATSCQLRRFAQRARNHM